MKALRHPVRIGEIVTALGGTLQGSPDVPVDHIAALEHATAGSLTFLADPRYAPLLATTEAACVIVPPKAADQCKGAQIVTDAPYLYYAHVTQWWRKHLEANSDEARIDSLARVHPDAHVAASARIAAGAVIDSGASVGERTIIGAGSYVGRNARVGSDCRIAPNVSVMHECTVGDRAIFHSGVVIGGDGFGFAPDHGRWVKIEQLGAVTVGNDVEIGANTCVDRGAIDDTVIEDGVKLDNLIQVAHNVHIGEGTAIASCTGISGSTHIGRRCQIAGGVGIAGHISIADDVVVLGATSVTHAITKPGVYSGTVPFEEAAAWRKNAAVIRHLADLRRRLREIEQQISPSSDTQ